MRNHSVTLCLIGIALSLLAVGFVSGTILRHIIQVLPAITAAALVIRAPATGRAAALAIFVMWLAIMILIWLFLLGIAQVVSGRFTPVEIMLTILIGVFCSFGVSASVRGTVAGGRGIALRIAAFVIALIAQIAAMWLSFQPWVARR